MDDSNIKAITFVVLTINVIGDYYIKMGNQTIQNTWKCAGSRKRKLTITKFEIILLCITLPALFLFIYGYLFIFFSFFFFGSVMLVNAREIIFSWKTTILIEWLQTWPLLLTWKKKTKKNAWEWEMSSDELLHQPS